MGRVSRLAFAAAGLSLVACAEHGADRSGAGGAAESTPAAAEPAPTSVTLGPLSAVLPSRADRPLRLENRALGLSATVTPIGASAALGEPFEDGTQRLVATPAVSNASLRYPSALGPGFDLRLRATREGVEDVISLPAAPTGDEVRYRVDLGAGVAGVRVAGGVVELVDAHGTPALRATRAAVIDGRGVRRELALDVEDCTVDRDVRPAWGRLIPSPGNDHCEVVVRLPGDLAYPAELDPLWSSADAMTIPRYDFRTALLDDGRILAAGGLGFGGRKEVELFDPTTKTWSLLGATGWLPTPAESLTMGKLGDGRVIVAGGRWEIAGSRPVATTLVFSTSTMTWTVMPDMVTEREDHTGTVLSDGRFLVAGGENYAGDFLDSAEIFDPTIDDWVSVSPMPVGHTAQEAVEVGGKVLFVGGITELILPVDDTYLFDPASGGSWTFEQPCGQARYGHVLARLGVDKVLMLGGYQASNFAESVEMYDLIVNQWTTLGTPPTSIYAGRGTPGPDGGVLVTGGCSTYDDYNYCVGPMSTALFFDTQGVSHPAGSFGVSRGKHAAVALADGRVVIMGGQDDVDPLADTEIFEVQAPGPSCALGFECASGFCVDGVCCDTACDGACESCIAVNTGGVDGTCAQVKDGTDPDHACLDSGAPACGTNGLCKAGACDTYAGPDCDSGKCVDGDDCASGFCVEGICCDQACAAGCFACSRALKGSGVDGVCEFAAQGTDPHHFCSDAPGPSCSETKVCDAKGACALGDAACAPQLCQPGGCIPGCIDDSGCAADGACVAHVCVSKSALCTEGSKALSRDGTVVDCAPFACTADGGCFTHCSSVDDCVGGSVCDDESGDCIPTPAETGGDEGCACEAAAPAGNSSGVFALVGAVALLLKRRRRRR